MLQLTSRLLVVSTLLLSAHWTFAQSAGTDAKPYNPSNPGIQFNPPPAAKPGEPSNPGIQFNPPPGKAAVSTKKKSPSDEKKDPSAANQSSATPK